MAVNLPASAAGQSVILKWRVASDTASGHTGYSVDSIAVTGDPAEFCDGAGADCPPDAFGPLPAVGNTLQVAYNAGTRTATISWTAEAQAGPFNVYRGSRPRLYDQACLATDVMGTSTSDADALAAKDYVYYLVSRRSAACLESSLGLASSGAERPNSSPCP